MIANRAFYDTFHIPGGRARGTNFLRELGKAANGMFLALQEALRQGASGKPDL